MKQHWLISVIEDLQKSARLNGYNTLASRLSDARLVAQLEIERTSDGGAAPQAVPESQRNDVGCGLSL